MCLDLPLHRLLALDHLHVEQIDTNTSPLVLVVTLTTPSAVCPDCARQTTRIHAGYRRTLADLPWAGRPVRLHLWVRRFVCEHPACDRMTFTERLPDLAPAYARTTLRLATIETDTGLAMGGAAGARLLAKQGMPTSRNTLLRRIRALPVPEHPPPTAVGLDDWAQRRGQTYGTLIVDLDRHRPIDLLPERSAETVATWLQTQPQIQLVSRDRAEAYAAGVLAGAPSAIQVADRWHLVKNLREAAERALQACPSLPWRTMPRTARAPVDTAEAGMAPRYPDTPSGRHADARRLSQRTTRRAAYDQACELRAAGVAVPVIAQRIGVSTRTLARWWAADGFPERKCRRPVPSHLDPYTAELLGHWEAGCHNATRLWHAIRAQGYTGSYGLVAGYLAPLRRGQPVRRSPDAPPPTTTMPAATSVLTARQLAFLLIRRPTLRTTSEQEYLAQLRQQDATVATIATLVEDFIQLLREQRPADLTGWLHAAETSRVESLVRFTRGLQQDQAAVQAALMHPYSNGQVEGQITRLKLYKRQMYGRAKLDLLRLRVLYAA